MGWSFWFHCLRDASWPQRWGVNVAVRGAGVVDGDEARRSSVVTDPSTVLLFDTEEGEGQPMVGQWTAGSDPGMLADCLSKYEVRIAEFAGISPADIQRIGGSAQSGYAISISQAGKREAQRRYAPQFRRGDLRTVELTARLLNIATDSRHPTEGYSIRYAAVPKSAQELDGERRHVLELLEAGLIDRIGALMSLNPGMTREEATRRIDEIRRLNLSTAA